jgi:hypothetical protein
LGGEDRLWTICYSPSISITTRSVWMAVILPRSATADRRNFGKQRPRPLAIATESSPTRHDAELLLGGLEGLGVVDSAKTADITPEVPAAVIYAAHS